MTTPDDPWVSPDSCPADDSNKFDDDFVDPGPNHAPLDEVSKGVKKIASKVDAIFVSNYLSNEEYAKKLEDKLKGLQKQKQPNGKDMLENLKERKDFYLNELLSGLDVHEDVTMTSPSFLDRLYSTNGVYRHLNPQQALDSSEKEPFAKHDYLAKTVDSAAPNTGGEDNLKE